MFCVYNYRAARPRLPFALTLINFHRHSAHAVVLGVQTDSAKRNIFFSPRYM